jgi:hypothetical protein
MDVVFLYSIAAIRLSKYFQATLVLRLMALLLLCSVTMLSLLRWLLIYINTAFNWLGRAAMK